MKLIAERPEDLIADIHLTLLRIAYPGFRFSVESRRDGRCRSVAVHRTIAVGVHTVVTDDLDELLTVLGPPGLSCQHVDSGLAEVVVLCARRRWASASSPPT